ncbi:MAG: galactosamine-6-phosphate isomerase [Verrucomicrobia bacterium]|nr:galactosamine-6-phosphate isomerase [Verrucomicrobiota bacterium]
MKSSIDVGNDHEDLSRKAANRIVDALARKPDLLLCAAGGSTPLRTYQLLAEHKTLKPDPFRSFRLVKLDEWGGIAMDDPGSCENQMQTLLIAPLGIAKDRYIGFKSDPANPEAECERVHKRLALEGPIDLCVLGLGMNGHVAMNEPAVFLKPCSHVARLAEATLAHPMLSKTKSPPTYGLSLGMAEILESREILLLVNGAKKREPLRRLLRREITTEFPASFLWLHPNWTLLCDRDATEGLNLDP